VPLDGIEAGVRRLLDELQAELLGAARARRDAATFAVDDYETFRSRLDAPGGFLLAHWCGDAACETRIKDETRATIRCLAFDQPEEAGACIACGRPSRRRAHFARAY
jgi:prolyl-tRNA synthetase